MKVTITGRKENPLLEREEVKGTISFTGATPSNAQLTEEVAKEINKDIKLIVVKNIYTNLSQQEAEFVAFVYNDEKVKEKIEVKTKRTKKKEEEEKKEESK